MARESEVIHAAEVDRHPAHPPYALFQWGHATYPCQQILKYSIKIIFSQPF